MRCRRIFAERLLRQLVAIDELAKIPGDPGQRRLLMPLWGSHGRPMETWSPVARGHGRGLPSAQRPTGTAGRREVVRWSTGLLGDDQQVAEELSPAATWQL